MLLVLDDLHELRSEEALRGLEQLLARAPAPLRTIILSRRDPKLGLHRLRLAGELTEIRAADLDFTAEEAGELLAAAGVAVGADDVGRLHARTEGWAAGLRLAAMSLARHDGARRASSPSSRAASARSPTTCSARCWPASRPRCAGCCCAPASSSASTARSPTC